MEERNQPMDYYMPARLHSGENCIEQHANRLLALGSSCLVVVDKTSAVASGALDDVANALCANDIQSMVWDGVTPNPPIVSCVEAGRLAASHQMQFILGVGGGSALDAAKAIAVFAANPELDEAGFYAFKWEEEPLPIALVGTTAGTGSEVTKVAVLTDSAARKHSIHDDRLYAAVAFGDSRYTHTCPPAVTLSCGVDVIAHATESYISHKADQISRAFAVRAIRLAWEPLSAAADGKELDPAQRRDLYEASILGGLAINTTGTCFPHNVGYYLTENYGVAHGFASAAFLPAMLACVRAYDAPYANAFYAEIGASEDEFVQLVTSCLPTLDISLTTEQIDAALPRWENNGSVNNTRATVSTEDIRETLIAMFA